MVRPCREHHFILGLSSPCILALTQLRRKTGKSKAHFNRVLTFLSNPPLPQVYADGSICLDILQHKWSPTFNIVGILTSIQSLLDEPNPNSPANAIAAKLFCENKREYERRVRECVEESWKELSDDDDDDEDDNNEGETAGVEEGGAAAACEG